MKKLSLLVCMFFVHIFLLNGFADNKKEIKIIEQNNNKIIFEFTPEITPYLTKNINGKNFIDFYGSADYSKPGTYNLPSRIFYFAIPAESKVNIFTEKLNKDEIPNVEPLRNPEVIMLNDSTIGYEESKSPQKYLKANDIEIIGYTYIRNFYCAIIRINNYTYNQTLNSVEFLTYLKASLVIEKNNDFKPEITVKGDFDNTLKDIIVNFDYSQNYQTQKSYSVSDTSGNWIDYSSSYIKLAVPFDGVYRIFFSDLVSYGINPSLINPRTFKIYHKGIEKPIYVFGEADGLFDANDYIEFFGESNYDSAGYLNIVPKYKDYINFYNRYTDTTIVWLAWNGAYGKRIPVQNYSLPGSLDSITTSQVNMHIEVDKYLYYYDATVASTQLPFWQEHKVFSWGWIDNNRTQNFYVNTANPVPNTKVKARVRLISNAGTVTPNTHKFAISVNRSPIFDTITFNYKQTVNYYTEFSSNYLNNGRDTIKFYGINTLSTFHRMIYDWIDLSFFRYNNAVNDSIYIIIPDSVQKAPRIIYSEGFSVNDTSLIIYKITPSIKRIQSFTLAGLTNKRLTFTDTVQGGDKYLIIKNTLIKKPKFLVKKQFVNLRNQTRGADYIIITNPILQSSAVNYRNFISSSYNVRTELIYVDDIYDEFNFGFLSAESIKDFLKSAYDRWVAPKPSYVLLIGDANYDYKNVWDPVPVVRKKNLVPSYGNPVSDSWYVWWDSTYIAFQQMFIGRIPANSNSELNNYLIKHQSYISRGYDDWNKLFMFFSGGNTSNSGELAQIKAANDDVINNLVKPAPFGGYTSHFYKIISPPGNFGTYTLEDVKKIIDKGALFISYIGHSGTRTWDNSITEVEHLKNVYSDRFPLITDFGCSTGKFAEPDVDAFGELFVSGSPNGQAIAYLGNSSWGYLSTSLSFPKIFYETLLKDSLNNFGRIHLLSKQRLFAQSGVNDVNRVFAFCNLLFGDPIIKLPFPKLPNLNINSSDVSVSNEYPNDKQDSLTLNINFRNLGYVIADSFTIKITDTYKDSVIFTKIIKLQLPLNDQSLSLSIPILKKPGTHKILINLNDDIKFQEITFSDNNCEKNISVYPGSLIPIEFDKFYNGARNRFAILNPLIKPESNINSIRFSISRFSNFSSANEYDKNFDTLSTTFSQITLPSLNLSLLPNQRYYWRVKLNSPNEEWSEVYSFVNTNEKFNWYFDTTFLTNDIFSSGVGFDSTSKSFKLVDRVISLKLGSAGGYDGSFASLSYDNKEQLTNTYFWGMVTAIIDSVSLKPSNIRYFVNPPGLPAAADSLRNYINSLPNGTWLAMMVCDDATGSVLNANVKTAIKTLGSYYIDSVNYRESWAMLGKKGAAIKSVPEAYKKNFTGPATIELTKSVQYDSGYFILPQISNSAGWDYLKISQNIPTGASLAITPIGIRINQSTDTLPAINITADSISLKHIDSKIYPKIKLMGKFQANSQKQSPSIYSIGANFTPAPELAINYQTSLLTRDTILQGSKDTLIFYIQNLGGAKADSFNISIEVLRSNNTTFVLSEEPFISLNPGERKYFQAVYKNLYEDGYGNFSFRVKIDPENRITEFLKTNNIFVIPFYIAKDTINTSVSDLNFEIQFDGQTIFNNDFVSNEPDIGILFKYPFWFPIRDTTAIEFELDESKINYSDLLKTNEDTNNRTVKFNYKPVLSDGLHSLRIYCKNIYGKFDNTHNYELIFRTTGVLKISNVYNYPNPFEKETHFTFSSTLPLKDIDELTIRIFTIAGRLIKEIKKTSSDFVSANQNFITIPWDGNDDDGDEIGNGVYLYKLTVKKGDKTETTTQKLVKVK